MSEEYGNDFVTLIDEDGNEVAVSYTHLATAAFSIAPNSSARHLL